MEPRRRKIEQLDAFYACIKECFMIGNTEVLYIPQKKAHVSPYGETSLPEEYSNHPQLALFYYSYMIDEHTFTAIRSNLLFEWPQPYVILNTIVRRLECHRFIVNNNYHWLPDQLKDFIGHGLECPNKNSIEGLTPFPESRRRRTIHICLGPADKIFEFFEKLTNMDAARSKFPHLSRLNVRFSCLKGFGNSLERVQRLARAIRKVWIYELVSSGGATGQRKGASSVKLEKTSGAGEQFDGQEQAQEQEPAQDNFQHEITDAASFWEKLSELESHRLVAGADDARQLKKAGAYLQSDADLQKEFKRNKNMVKNIFYSYVKSLMSAEGQVKFNRGVKCLQNGIVNVNLSYGPCKWIKAVTVSLAVQSKHNEAQDVTFVLKCSMSYKDYKKIATGN
ncbi:LAFA_0G18712g1_1 [Lachancea sp. 'fantastica']|nr:LAFA_0G18712g1_1 [Lachancea sp. 'fantastica']